jgi:hypothetical protein
MMAKNRAEYPQIEEDGDVELELRMENAGAARQRTCDASSFGADEWVESGPPASGLNNGPNGNRKTS